MKTEKRKLGDLGEGVTCNYLKNKGFTITEQNYWKPWGEIDIIAKKQDILHFIEVKTVSREIPKDVTREKTLEEIRGIKDKYKPEDNLHPWKLKRLGRVIQTYLMNNNIDEEIEYQFDIVCVYLDTKNKIAKVEYMEDVVF